MKILHTSDLHIGSPLTARLSPEKIRERKGELLANFEKMIEEAVYRRVSLFIIAGDLFDSERITKSTAERVIGAMARVPSVEFLYLSGNHEKNALLESCVKLPENLKLFGYVLAAYISRIWFFDSIHPLIYPNPFKKALSSFSALDRSVSNELRLVKYLSYRC